VSDWLNTNHWRQGLIQLSRKGLRLESSVRERRRSCSESNWPNLLPVQRMKRTKENTQHLKHLIGAERQRPRNQPARIPLRSCLSAPASAAQVDACHCAPPHVRLSSWASWITISTGAASHAPRPIDCFTSPPDETSARLQHRGPR